MSDFVDRSAPAGREAPNIIRISEAEREPRFQCEVTRTLVLSAGRGLEALAGASQWLEALLKQLAPNERFFMRLPFASAERLSASVATIQRTQEALEQRKAELEAAMEAVLSASLAGVRIEPPAAPAAARPPPPYLYEIRPEGQKIDETSFQTLGLRAVPQPDDVAAERTGIYVAQNLAFRPDFAALGRLMAQPSLSRATVTLSIERFKRDVRLDRILRRTYQPLADALASQSSLELLSKGGFAHALLAHLAWLNAGACQRVIAEVAADEPLRSVLLEMISQAIYGAPLAETTPDDHVDLTRAWPDCTLGWLERLPHLLARRRDLAHRQSLAAKPESGLRLGRIESGAPIYLAGKARPQHAFILGQTGTGKSSFIRNLIAQDMEAGEAVILFDAHGDLAQDVRRSVPTARRSDIVYLHPTDPEGAFTLNIFEPLGDKPAVEHNRVANDLINLFKRVYPEPKDAYGPMFMLYARNAIFLLLSAGGPEATVLDIARVFSDDRYRRELTKECPREDVRAFWRDVAEDVHGGGDSPTIDNVAPYIVAKLTQLSGNEVMRPIIGAAKSSLDFRAIAAERKICIVNLDLPGIGEEDAKILGGLLFSRLSAYLQTQAKLAPKSRIPLRVYLDEVQTYADDSLAQSMAQMRKFGLSYTLASQHFAALDGGGWRPDVGRAILGNASSLILFRLGYFDAKMLAPYMAPVLTADDLIQLPNFHAAARLLSANGEMTSPLVFETDPPLG